MPVLPSARTTSSSRTLIHALPYTSRLLIVLTTRSSQPHALPFCIPGGDGSGSHEPWQGWLRSRLRDQMQQEVDGPAGDLPSRVAVHPLGGRVPTCDNALGRRADDG